jgi:hypothetical protein
MIDNTAIDNLWIEWIKALKSKKSLNNTPICPTTLTLRKRNHHQGPDGYCCLGVLCLVSDELEMNLTQTNWTILSEVSPTENAALFNALNDEFQLHFREIVRANDERGEWPIEFLIEEIAPEHLKETLRNL